MINIDAIPDALKEGENWPLLDLDPEWVWLSETAGVTDGILIAAPCHGLAFIWRVKMSPGAPATALLRLLRRFIRDCRERRILGFLAMLDVCRAEEQALSRIAFRAGAHFTTATTVIYGSINTGHLGEV